MFTPGLLRVPREGRSRQRVWPSRVSRKGSEAGNAAAKAVWREDHEIRSGAVNSTCERGQTAAPQPPEGWGTRKEIKGSFKWSGTRQLK